MPIVIFSQFDLYIQKVNDFAHIQINQKIFQFNNFVKLFNANKSYYLEFEVNHLIKLDNNFLDAEITFIDKNGIEYILNKDQRVIQILKGIGIEVNSNKNALLYFYQKMDNNSELGMIEFNKTQKGKILKFNINNLNDDGNIFVAKDYGFKGYYPMLNKSSWEKITIGRKESFYFDKFYESDLLYENEGEKYYIYI